MIAFPWIVVSVDRFEIRGHCSTEGIDVRGAVQHHEGLGLARDRVVRVPALERGQTERSVARDRGERTGEQLRRVAPLQHDVDSRVTALQAGQMELNRRGFRGHGFPFEGQASRCIGAHWPGRG